MPPRAPVPPAEQPEPGSSTGDQERRRRVTRTMLWQSALLLTAFLTASLWLPWKLLTAAAGLGAFVLGVRVWMLSRGLDGMGLLRLTTGIGTAVGAAVAALSLTPLFFWNQSMALQECLFSSLTQRSAAACQTEFSSSVTQIENLFAPGTTSDGG